MKRQKLENEPGGRGRPREVVEYEAWLKRDRLERVRRGLIDMVPRLFATFPVTGAALIGVLAAVAAVVIVQPVMANVTGNPALTIETGAIAGAVGLLAYAGWRAAIEPDTLSKQADVSATATESAQAAVALSNEALLRLLIESIESCREALRALVGSEGSSLPHK